jgi:hypothetical protein
MAGGSYKLCEMKVELDPAGIRESIALWRDAVDLKLDMRPDIRSHMIVMRAKILERFSATASSWQTVLASCTAEGDDALQLQRVKEEVDDFKVWAHENLKVLADLVKE